MSAPAPSPDDDQPIGLPRIDGDDDRDGEPPAHDLEGLGVDDDEVDAGLDDGGFLEPESEVDDLDGGVDDDAASLDDWETSESLPHEDDPSIELPDETSWLGAASTEGADELWPSEPEAAGEHAPSALDAGEEGFAGEAPGADLETEDGASALGAADEEGLDEVPAFEGATDAGRVLEPRALLCDVETIPSDVPASAIVALALEGASVLALAASGGQGTETIVLLERGGRLTEAARVAGAPRGLCAHPTLGVYVVTSVGLARLDGTMLEIGLAALVPLGAGLLGLRDDGTVLSGSGPGTLEPRPGAPTRALLVAPSSEGGAALLDPRGGVHVLSALGASRALGPVPPRAPRAIAAAGGLCAVLTQGGGAWVHLGPEHGFEPEPALRGVTAIAAGTRGAPHLLGVGAGSLVRVGAHGLAESCALPGGRVLFAGADGVVLCATDVEVLRLRVPERAVPEGDPDDETG